MSQHEIEQGRKLTKQPKSPPPPAEEPPNFKALVERALLPLAAVGAFAATVIAAITQSEKLVELVAERPGIVGLVVAIAAAVVLWAICAAYAGRVSVVRMRRIQWIGTALIAVAYIGFVSYSRWCTAASLCKPARWRPVTVGSILSPISTAMAAEPPLVLESVVVDTERSSFTLSTDEISIHATRDSQLRPSLQFDNRMQVVFRNASCRSLDGERPITDALPIWRTLLTARGQQALAGRLSNYAGYRQLISQGGDTFFEAIPNAAELADLKSRQPGQYGIVMRWLANCVGLADPVLIWTIRNRSNGSQTLTHVDYWVQDIGQVMSAGPGAVELVDVQMHALAHVKGHQVQALNPQIQLPAGAVVSIRIRYLLDAGDMGLTWLVKPTFSAAGGASLQGPEIKIFSAKNPR